MLKKRAILYFLIMGFPIGLGVGIPSWVRIPRVFTTNAASVAAYENDASVALTTAAVERVPPSRLPDFGAIHPIVVGSFTLLFCTGVLLSADRSSEPTPS